MKILHLISSLTRGGRERQLATIVANTNMELYPTKIVYFNKRQNSYIDDYDLVDNTIQIQSHGRLARLKELHLILKIEKPDIVFTWGNGESVSILMLKPLHKFKFINGSIRHGIRSKSFSHYLRTLVLHLSPHVVANSFAGLRANNLKRGYVLYNGIDNKIFTSLSQQQKAQKKKDLFGMSENQILFISIANQVPYKDYFSILKALKLFKEENYSFKYLILGDGPLKKDIEQTIAEYELVNNVRILGNVFNVNEYLQLSDAFIHSSIGEGCSNAILEAMYSGLPIIVSNVGGVPETIYTGSAMLFPYKDHKALFQCLLEIPKLKASFDAESEEYKAHLKKFSVETMINRFEEIIQTVMQEKSEMKRF